MTPFVGQIQAFGFGFAPVGWAFCNGSLLAISQYTAVFSLLGTTFGGDGRTTFGLPDLRGRSIVHVGTGPGLSTISWGEKSGRENITLTTANLPSHNHAASIHTGAGVGNTATATGNNFASNAVADTIYNAGTPSAANAMINGNVVISNTGGSQAFNSRNPFLGVYVCIALQGVYPSRS